MNSRGGPPFFGAVSWWILEADPHFWGYILMGSTSRDNFYGLSVVSDQWYKRESQKGDLLNHYQTPPKILPYFYPNGLSFHHKLWFLTSINFQWCKIVSKSEKVALKVLNLSKSHYHNISFLIYIENNIRHDQNFCFIFTQMASAFITNYHFWLLITFNIQKSQKKLLL